MSRQPPGAPPPPPVQRIRLRYTKRGRLRFTSHRDIARVFERALRRAEVPMAYSAGFSPHPKVSWVGAAATGVASEAEYVEIALAEVRPVEDIRTALDAALTGLRSVSDLATPVPPAATRLPQGPLTADGEVGDPLAPDALPSAAGATRQDAEAAGSL